MIKQISKEMLSATLVLCGITVALGQEYPNKPIRIIASEAGGGSDIVARLIAQAMVASLGQPLIVDNRAATIPAESAAKAPADGYTLLFSGSVLWITELLNHNVTYNTARDYSPITLVASTPNVLVVPPSIPVSSVKDLIALAKSKPGELNYASAALGSSNHLAAELFKASAGINLTRVSYKGPAAALNAVIGNEAQLMFPAAGSASPHLKSGRVKGLAVTSLEPSLLAPGLPPLASAGVQGYECSQVYGVLAPKNTPNAIINRLNQEVQRVLARPDIKERLFSTGLQTVASSPQEFAATIRSDMAKWARLIKQAGISQE